MHSKVEYNVRELAEEGKIVDLGALCISDGAFFITDEKYQQYRIM